MTSHPNGPGQFFPMAAQARARAARDRGRPELWLLGSSDYSGLLAAQLGVRFSFAHFINAKGGDVVMRAYKERFHARTSETDGPAPCEAAPHTSVCCFVVCAATDEEAERRAKVVDLRRLEMAYNLDTPVPTQAQAEQRAVNPEEREYIRSQRPRLVHGSADTCREKLLAIAQQFSADEIMVLTITGDYATRERSYELLARELALPQTAPGAPGIACA